MPISISFLRTILYNNVEQITNFTYTEYTQGNLVFPLVKVLFRGSDMGFFDFLRKYINDDQEDGYGLASIYKVKGCYCDEYLDAFMAECPEKNNDNRFTLCEIYTELERYEEAQDCLDPITPSSILDDITRGQLLHCRIMLFIETGKMDRALELFSDNKKFLDRFMKNPVRSKISGDFYSNAALLCAFANVAKDEDIYIKRLREWCDLFPKNRLLLEITQVKILLLKKSEEAEDAFALCRETILDFPDFQYEWEREYYLKKLDRAKKLFAADSN